MQGPAGRPLYFAGGGYKQCHAPPGQRSWERGHGPRVESPASLGDRQLPAPKPQPGPGPGAGTAFGKEEERQLGFPSAVTQGAVAI